MNEHHFSSLTGSAESASSRALNSLQRLVDRVVTVRPEVVMRLEGREGGLTSWWGSRRC